MVILLLFFFIIKSYSTTNHIYNFKEKAEKDYTINNNGELPKEQQIFGRAGHNFNKGTVRDFMYKNNNIQKYLKSFYENKYPNNENLSVFINIG